jgi:hypothetical protein
VFGEQHPDCYHKSSINTDETTLGIPTMTTKTSPFVLYKTFIDAYMKGHPEIAKSVCNLTKSFSLINRSFSSFAITTH